MIGRPANLYPTSRPIAVNHKIPNHNCNKDRVKTDEEIIQLLKINNKKNQKRTLVYLLFKEKENLYYPL